MALFDSVFLIGLLFLNGNILSASAFYERTVNEQGPEPRLKIVQESDLDLVIATPSKLHPIYLPCSAVVTIDDQFIEDNKLVQPKLNAYDDIDEEDGDDEDLLGDDYTNANGNETEEERKQRIEARYRQEFNKLRADDDPSPFRDKHGNIVVEEPADEDENDEDGDADLANFRFRRAIKRSDKEALPHVEYTWFRNDEKLLSTTEPHHQPNGFRLFANGTLRIQYSNQTAAGYRCLANETKFGVGSVLSREIAVDVASLVRDPQAPVQQNATILATIGYPIVLNCPFISYPAANVTWFFNKQPIQLDGGGSSNNDNRHLLLNGSLLILAVRASDFGKYRCNATNNLTPKTWRSSGTNLAESPPSAARNFGLMPTLQNHIQKIIAGHTLRLYCASYSDKVTWTFTPHNSRIPIELKTLDNELKFVNVSVKKHEGVYNCSSETDYHIYNVTVLTPPHFVHKYKSILSSVAASVTFNCSVTGNPEPQVTWYKNGRLLKNSYVVHFEQHILRIQSIEPEDEGIYQCMAKNDVGEVVMSEWLTLRNKHQYKNFPHRPDNLRCYPLDYKSVLVTFETKESFHMINYYLSSEHPYTWLSAPPQQVYTNNSFHIVDSLKRFQPYALYLRGMVQIESLSNSKMQDRTHVMLTRLSRSVKCATQGLTVYSTTAPNGIFIWWNQFSSLNFSSVVVQFWHNDTTNPTVFADQVIGTRKLHAEFMDWTEVEANLVKIPVTTKVTVASSGTTKQNKKRRVRRSQHLNANVKQILDSLDTGGESGKRVVSDKTSAYNSAATNVTITEVIMDGNVSGILIPNSYRVIVRVLVSVLPGGELVEQDLRYLHWKTIDWSSDKPVAVVNFRETGIEPNNLQFSWQAIGDAENHCLKICYKNLDQHFIPVRGTAVDCEEITSSLTSITIANLQSATMFKVYLRSCDDPEPISRVLKVQTKQDIPGPVTKQNAVRDKDGIALQWEKPRLANGKVLYYQIEWTNKNGTEAYTTTVEPDVRMYRFPNATVQDKFNITIRAVSLAGLGIPAYVNLSQLNDTVMHQDTDQPENPLLGIVIGLLLALVFIAVCTWCLLKNRTCKKHWNMGHNNQPLPTGPGNGPNPPNTQLNSNHTDLHEMQTLIRKNELPTLVPNGKTTTAKILLDGKDQFENFHSEHEKKRGHVSTYSDLELSDVSETDDIPKLGLVLTNGSLPNGQVMSFRVPKGSPTLRRAQNHLDSQITGIEVINSKPPSFSSFISRTDSSPSISPIVKSVEITLDELMPVPVQVEPFRTNSNHFLDYVESSPSSSTISSINSANTVIHNQSPLVTTKKTNNHNQQQQQQQPPQQHSSIFINNNNNNSNNSSIKSNSNHNRIKDNLQYLNSKSTDKTAKTLLPQSLSSSGVGGGANNNIFDPHNDSNDTSIYLDDSQQQLLDTTIDSPNHHYPCHQPPNGATTTNNSNHHQPNRLTNGYHQHNGDGGAQNVDVGDNDDSYETCQYDLDDSNMSNKPLHLKWNFRQPIIGPNG